MNIKEITDWFRAAVPEPTDANKSVQLGCHFEEIAEMAASLGLSELTGDICVASEDYKLGLLEEFPVQDHKALLDSLCDQIVTAIGVAHMFGMDIEGALTEVNRSNWSKFNEDGRPDFDANGKIKKGPSYSPPELAPFLEKPPMLRLPVVDAMT